AAIIVARAALFIAGLVDRLHDLFGELPRLAQHRLDQAGGGIGKTGQIVVAADLEHVGEQGHRIVDGGPVDRHVSPPGAATSAGMSRLRTGATLQRATPDASHFTSLVGSTWRSDLAI